MHNLVSLLKRRPASSLSRFDSPKKESTYDPYHPYREYDNAKNNELISNLDDYPNPSLILTKYHESSPFLKSNLDHFSQNLKNNAKRGLRDDDQFKKFIKFMNESRKNADQDLSKTKDMLRKLGRGKDKEEDKKKNEFFGDKMSPEQIKLKSKILKKIDSKGLEKKIRNLAEKMNNNLTLVHINKILEEIYEEKRKPKKIIKYLNIDNLLSPNTETNILKKKRPFSSAAIQFKSQSTKMLEYAEREEDCQNENQEMPLPVRKALILLKNFAIDTNLDDDKYGEESIRNQIAEKQKRLAKKEPLDYLRGFRSPSKNKEKHLKNDFKLFKEQEGYKLLRKFTVNADEEAHQKEMNYYLGLIRLKKVELPKTNKNQDVYSFNNALRKIYRGEQLIRSHGGLLRKKFKPIQNKMKEIDEMHFNKQEDKLGLKIHKDLMNDYKKEEKKILKKIIDNSDIGRQMKIKLKHQNTL